MFSRIWSIVRKEFIQIVRDPRTLAMVLVMPVMQLLLFGYAINRPSTTSRWSFSTRRAPPTAGGSSRPSSTRPTSTSPGRSTARRRPQTAIDGGRRRRGWSSRPTSAGWRSAAGRPGPAPGRRLGPETSPAPPSSAPADRAGQGFGVDGRAAPTPGPRPAGAAIDLRPIVLYNPSLESVNFMIPGLIGLILQFQTLILTAFAVVRERERGTLEQLIVTPIGSWELMLGKILPFVVIAFAQMVIALGLGVFWFGVGVAGSVVLLLALSSSSWSARSASGCSSRPSRDPGPGDAACRCSSCCRRSCSPASCSRARRCLR